MNLGILILSLVMALIIVFGFSLITHAKRHDKNRELLKQNKIAGKVFDPLTCEELVEPTRTIVVVSASGKRIEVRINRETDLSETAIEHAFNMAEQHRYPRDKLYAIEHPDHGTSVGANLLEILMIGNVGFLLKQYVLDQANRRSE